MRPATGKPNAPRAPGTNRLSNVENEIQEHLYRCIARLPQTMRAAITLRELEDCETPEICKQLMISATNLNVILYRARMHLRACLEAFGFRSVN
ncbi:MAG: sigma factor-like helix-turn-helix DNA-binding protein [Pseudomonadota bacterium]